MLCTCSAVPQSGLLPAHWVAWISAAWLIAIAIWLFAVIRIMHKKKLWFAIQCSSPHFGRELDELIDAELLDSGVQKLANVRSLRRRANLCKLPSRHVFTPLLSQFLSFTTNVKCAGTASSEFLHNFNAKTRLDNRARRQSTSLVLILTQERTI